MHRPHLGLVAALAVAGAYAGNGPSMGHTDHDEGTRKRSDLDLTSTLLARGRSGFGGSSGRGAMSPAELQKFSRQQARRRQTKRGKR